MEVGETTGDDDHGGQNHAQIQLKHTARSGCHRASKGALQTGGRPLKRAEPGEEPGSASAGHSIRRSRILAFYVPVLAAKSTSVSHEAGETTGAS